LVVVVVDRCVAQEMLQALAAMAVLVVEELARDLEMQLRMQ
jgi:hypothetical protein